jgi:CubicO group peptidase (beta-lactamase class C family)
MKLNKIPSVLAIVKNYKISEVKTFNCRKNTRFQAASISKIVTALLVLKLVEEKKLDLNKDVNFYLKGFKVRNKKGELIKVTLKQLLSHTTGINVPGFPGYTYNSKLPSIRQILNGEKPCNTGKIFVQSKPGKKHSYSGGGYMIIQKIIEDVSGKKYEDLVKNKIFRPIGMKGSDFRLRKSRKFRRYPEKAAAGLWSTAEDLAKLLIEIQLSVLGKSNKIISKQLLKLMVTPIVKAEGDFVGLGLFIKKDKKSFLHDGHNYKFKSKIVGRLDGRSGYVILVNSDRMKDLKILEKVVK